MLVQLEALLLELAADPLPAALELALAALSPPLPPAAALELELAAAVGLELKKESPPKEAISTIVIAIRVCRMFEIEAIYDD